ncbi:MAG: hypothetical protein ACI30Q_02900 [Muribaculaceae bacterium]
MIFSQKFFFKQLQPCQEAIPLPRSGYSVYYPTLERSDYVGTADAHHNQPQRGCTPSTYATNI